MYFPPKIQSAMARSASAARISSRPEGRPIFSSSLAAQAGTSAPRLICGGESKESRDGQGSSSGKAKRAGGENQYFQGMVTLQDFLLNFQGGPIGAPARPE